MTAERKRYLEGNAEALVRNHFFSTCERNNKDEAVAWLQKVRNESSKMLNAHLDEV